MMAKKIPTIEHYWAVVIGRRPKYEPYFAADEVNLLPRLFANRPEATAFRGGMTYPKDARVARVEIREEDGR